MKKLFNRIRVWFAKKMRTRCVRRMFKAAELKEKSLNSFHYYDDLISKIEESM